MASITIRDLDPDLKERLRVQAARHGRSMEEEARVILKSAMASAEAAPLRLGDSIRRRFEHLGGVDILLPPRDSARDPPRLG